MRALVLYAVLCVLYVRSLTDRACVREEGDVRQALAELYDSAGGERWVSSDGWSGNRRTQSCCTWYGVHCAAGINHSGIVEVLSVRMVANGLRGDFSAILSVLERFCSLETLDLSSNRISGTIPHSVVRMARLQTLRLEENLIAGVIPDEIAGLSRLRELILARNSLDGTLPRSLGVMKSLRHVNLGSNNFVGELPSQWAGLRWWRRADDADGHAMEFFSVAYNQLVGLVPAFLVDIPLQTVVELHVRYSPHIPWRCVLPLARSRTNQRSHSCPDAFGSNASARGACRGIASYVPRLSCTRCKCRTALCCTHTAVSG